MSFAADVDSASVGEKAASPNTTLSSTIGDLRKGKTACTDSISLGGLDWNLYVSRVFEDATSLVSPSFLVVGISSSLKSTQWTARLQAVIKVTLPDGTTIQEKAVQRVDNRDVLKVQITDWDVLEKGFKDVSDVISVEATFIVEEVTGIRKRLAIYDHSKAHSRFNAVMIIDGKKVYVTKEVLAFHSLHFEALFFGCDSGASREEYELQGVSFEDFMLLLAHLRTPTAGALKEATVESLLRVATKLAFPEVIEQCERLLLSSESMLLNEKLKLADQFALPNLEKWTGFRSLSERLQLAVMTRGLFAHDDSDDDDDDEDSSDWDESSCEEEIEEEEEEEGDKEAFALFDSDGDGRISMAEALKVMHKLGFTRYDQENAKFVTTAGKEGKGSVDYEGFCKLMQGLRKVSNKKDELCAAFKVFDKKDKGYIISSDLRSFLKRKDKKDTEEKTSPR